MARNNSWVETWREIDSMEVDSMLLIELETEEQREAFKHAFRSQNYMKRFGADRIVFYTSASNGKIYVIRAK